MYQLLGLIILSVSFSSFAQVLNPYSSLCQHSASSDSYGRGIESAFTGEDLRIRYNDESCYQLGLEAAQNAIKVEGRASCKHEFDQGHPEGFSASANGAGVKCYNLGYSAGKAALGAGAREGNRDMVGIKCVNAYMNGRTDGRANRAPSPGTSSQPEVYCYQLGHFESPLFN